MEKFVQKITREAGKSVYEKFGKIGVKYSKDNISDVVTEADLVSNRLITAAIKARYPKHSIVSEEEGEYVRGAEYTWIIDPLDGTRNFATQTPFFGTMVGLARNNEMILAAHYDPNNDELYFAKKDEGAFKNDSKIRCSQKKEFVHSYGTGPASYTIDGRAPFMKLLIDHSVQEPFWITCIGSAMVTANLVADGRRDWYWSIGGKIWDYAPASLLLKESGCMVTDIEGKHFQIGSKSIVAANKYLHPALMKIMFGRVRS